MNKKLFLNIVALICGIWFVLAGWLWVYFFNLIFVFPVALIGSICWYKGRNSGKKILNRVAGATLVLGHIISVGAMFFYQ